MNLDGIAVFRDCRSDIEANLAKRQPEPNTAAGPLAEIHVEIVCSSTPIPESGDTPILIDGTFQFNTADNKIPAADYRSGGIRRTN